MTEPTPYIDFENLPAPSEGFLVTQFITVRSVARSRAFYSEVLGGQVVLEANPCIIKLANSWLIMNPGGPPTPDKPDISVVNYEPGNTVSSFMNLRVADIHGCYEQWRAEAIRPERPVEITAPHSPRGASAGSASLEASVLEYRGRTYHELDTALRAHLTSSVRRPG